MTDTASKAYRRSEGLIAVPKKARLACHGVTEGPRKAALPHVAKKEKENWSYDHIPLRIQSKTATAIIFEDDHILLDHIPCRTLLGRKGKTGYKRLRCDCIRL